MATLRTGAATTVAAAAILALAACGGDSGPDDSPGTANGTGGNGSGDNGAAGDTVDDLVISLQFTPRANWALETDDAFVLTQIGCLETLARYDAASGELEPLLATSWEQTEPTAWDFTLRDDVTFQDGTPFTSESVVTALDRLLTADVPPRPFTPAQISSVEALDESTVRITTPEPSALIPFRLAAVNTGILAESAYAEGEVTPVGTCTGPFEIASYTPNQSVTVERFDEYWGEAAQLSTVEARFFPEGATRATQVRTDESQIALAVPIATIADLEADADLVVTRAFTPRTSGLYLNNQRAPFDDPAVRQAVQLALDLELIAATIYDGAAQPAVGPFSPDAAWAPADAAPVARDLGAARAALSSAGYSDGDISVTLLAYTERAEFADLAAVIQAQLGEAGITVDIQTGDYSSIEPSLLGGDYDIALLSRNHLTDIADPIGYLTADYTCEGTYNISQFCDPAVDARVEAANGESDPAARHVIYAELAEELQAEAVTVFLVHEQTLAVHRTTVEGFVDDPLARYAITTDVVRRAG